MSDTQAGLVNLALVIVMITAFHYAARVYSYLQWQLRRRVRNAKRVRAWRCRITAMADQPFRMPSLTTPERSRLIGRNGQTSEEWARAAAADFIAGRREAPPTFGDYLREFGRRPKIGHASGRTA